MKKIISIVAGIILSYSCYAANPYFGVGIGQATAKDSGNCSDLAVIFDPGYSCSIDDTGTSFNLFAGYNFMPNFAGEVGYIDLGKYKIAASGTVLSTPVSVDGEIKGNGITVSAVGSFPIQPNFLLLGRFGIFNWNLDLNVTATSGTTTGGSGESASGSDLFYGIGMQWNANNNLSFRGEWTHFPDVGDQYTTGQSDIDNLSISLVYYY